MDKEPITDTGAQYDAAIIAMQGLVDEANTVITYTQSLKALSEKNVDAEKLNRFKEIIADELNHIEKFGSMYSDLSAIMPNGP